MSDEQALALIRNIGGLAVMVLNMSTLKNSGNEGARLYSDLKDAAMLLYHLGEPE